MLHRILVRTIILTALLATAACQGKNETPPSAAPSVSLDEFLQPLRKRLSFEEIVFFGDSAWAIDYSGNLYSTTDSGQNWSRVALPDDGLIKTMQFEDGGTRGLVVNNSGVLMQTADAGQTWTSLDLVEYVRDSVTLDYGGYFNQIEFDTLLENGVWIDYCQIFQTADGGKTWKRLADALQDQGAEERCVADAVYKPASDTWFASVEIVGRMLTSGDYLFRSGNGGSTWQEICSLDEVGLLLKKIPSCFDLGSDDIDLKAAVAQFTEDYWSSDTDEQQAFYDQVKRGIFGARSLTLPKDTGSWYERAGLVRDRMSDRVWLYGGEQLAYTDDDGNRWHVVASPLPDNDVLDFSLGSARGFAVFDYEFLAVSEDIGRTWKIVNDDPQVIYDYRVLPDHDRVIVATETGLAVVDTESLEWREVPEVKESAQLVVAGSVAWAFTGGGSVHRSTDAGATWMMLSQNLEQHDFYVESASCTANHCLLGGYQSLAHLTAEPFAFEIVDLTEPLPNPDENYVVETILNAELGRVWIAMENGNLYASFGLGRSWQELADLGEEIREFRSASGDSNFVAWGNSNRYLWSADGETFETRRLPVREDIAIDALCWLDDSTALFAAYDYDREEALYFASLDGGATWGPTDPVGFGKSCRVRGNLVVLESVIATLP